MATVTLKPASRHAWALGACLAICLAAEAIGGALTASGLRSWYATLEKPSWNPPNWVFGPVWTVLYLMMGTSIWLVWRRLRGLHPRTPFVWFAVQLVLNVVWSALFFTFRSPGIAAAEILALWLTILLTIIAFIPISRPAAWLMTPYLAWVSFASALNLTVWWLNA